MLHISIHYNKNRYEMMYNGKDLLDYIQGTYTSVDQMVYHLTDLYPRIAESSKREVLLVPLDAAVDVTGCCSHCS